jgi:hypothetical integral membrane protein (TIGR02206 family)
MSAFLSDSIPFATFGTQHLLTLMSFITLVVATLLIASRWTNAGKKRLFRGACWSVFSIYVILLLLLYSVDGIQPSYNLPLYLCNITGLALPLFAHRINQPFFEVFYFWIIGGTLQAIITPDLTSGFPSFYYFKYWILHLGLVYVILIATFVLGYRPRFKGIWLAWICLELYFILMLGVNYLLGSNYLYLNEKPAMPTALDFFGPWPIYVVVVQLIVIPVFILLYLPFRGARIRD